MKKHIVSPKIIYITILCIIPLFIYTTKPTYSKFTQTITTDEDIVNINTNINLKINDVKEYKNIEVGSKDYEIYTLELKNNTDKRLYYKLWHSQERETIKNKVKVSILKDKDVEIKETIESYETVKIPIIIKNNSNNKISINIGALTSDKDIESITYSNNQIPIEREDYEADIYYDNSTNKYYYSMSNTELSSFIEEKNFNYNESYQTYTAPFSGYYQIQLWGPLTDNQGGDYLSSDIYLKKNQSVYLYLGKALSKGLNAETDLRLIPSKKDNEESLNSRILIAGNDINSTYIYGYDKNNLEENSYVFNLNKKFNIRESKNTIVTPKTNQSDGFSTISYIENQEPTIEGIKYVYKNNDFKLDNIICKDNGKGCKLIKVRPSSTKNLDIGTYKITYIVSDDDNITYKYQSTFEVIEKN